jgi:hypothetical protein
MFFKVFDFIEKFLQKRTPKEKTAILLIAAADSRHNKSKR